MFCPECGRENSDSAKLCWNCGFRPLHKEPDRRPPKPDKVRKVDVSSGVWENRHKKTTPEPEPKPQSDFDFNKFIAQESEKASRDEAGRGSIRDPFSPSANWTDDDVHDRNNDLNKEIHHHHYDKDSESGLGGIFSLLMWVVFVFLILVLTPLGMQTGIPFINNLSCEIAAIYLQVPCGYY